MKFEMRSVVMMLALLGAGPMSAGCPVTLPANLGDCADGTTLTWSEVEPIFAENCAGCHSSTLSGDDRNGAPEDVDFDSPDWARDADWLTWSQIHSERMPDDGPMSSPEDALLVWEWLSCGGPD